MKDKFSRNIDYIRISITDRCNLRCVYCMPKEGIPMVEHKDIMTFDEIIYICNILAELGFKKVKLTGGEPLVRKNVVSLIKDIKKIKGIESVTLTTNGVLLKEMVDNLYNAGIDGINVSIDTMNKEKYFKITRYDKFDDVWEGIYETLKYTKINLKLNVVPIDINENEIIELVKFNKDNNVHIRFIEMMPIGYGKEYKSLSQNEIYEIIQKEFGDLEKYNETLGNGPAKYYSIEGFMGKIGFISAISHKFCNECNRIRLTSQGFLKTCLQYDKGVSLLSIIRNGGSKEEVKLAIINAIKEKPLEHSFLQENIDKEESKSMYQIGG